jgi:hypothetical protein
LIASSVTLCNGIADTIKERAEPGRQKQISILIEAHVAPFDRGSEISRPACLRGNSPALSDLLGSRGD